MTRFVPRSAPALALLLTAALVAAGCGKDKAETFKKDFRPLDAKVVTLGTDVGKAVRGASGKSDRQLQQQFSGLAGRTASLRRQVDKLDAPDKLKSDQGDMVDSMGDAGKALGDISKAAGASNPQAARRATIQLVAASQTLRSARDRLARATGAKR